MPAEVAALTSTLQAAAAQRKAREEDAATSGVDNVAFTRVLGGSGSVARAAPAPKAVVELAEWYYTDPQKQQQGPFTLSQMQQWYAQGFLPDDTEAKHVDDAEWATIGQHSRIYSAASTLQAVLPPAHLGPTGAVQQTRGRQQWRTEREQHSRRSQHSCQPPLWQMNETPGQRAAREANERMGFASALTAAQSKNGMVQQTKEKKKKKRKKDGVVGVIHKTPSFAARRTTRDHQPNESSMGSMVAHD